jgi:hypothetical protein
MSLELDIQKITDSSVKEIMGLLDEHHPQHVAVVLGSTLAIAFKDYPEYLGHLLSTLLATSNHDFSDLLTSYVNNE